MTDIIVHGILAKEFRSHFKFAIRKPQEIFDAISCICPQFRNRLVELANQGIHYSLLIDGKKVESEADLRIAKDGQTIDLIPTICGAGSNGGIIAMLVIGIATAGVGLAAAGVFGAAAAGIAGTIGVSAGMAATITNIGIGLIGMGIQAALAPKPNMERPSSDVSAAKQSFNFSSKANVAEQGIPVPVGYGRLRIGSVVIQSSIKSYPQAFRQEDAIDELASQSITNTAV
jgi:predicted phage tail protein